MFSLVYQCLSVASGIPFCLPFFLNCIVTLFLKLSLFYLYNELITIIQKKTHIANTIYKIINSLKLNTVSDSLEKIWENDLEENIDCHTWTSVWQRLHRISKTQHGTKQQIMSLSTGHIIPLT